ncbi:MAG: TonB-dependent receptor [Gammaproteobacteria bacterium]|nr:TonB-dependent receptor [Gammaproteobacteria bacterium]MBU1731055.1 TonB-dependent receptor [Gammaproteobacteria bacterium]MBU1894123.1 TonB-dependent receptor [Gammaproteobacteria bacterium]
MPSLDETAIRQGVVTYMCKSEPIKKFKFSASAFCKLSCLLCAFLGFPQAHAETPDLTSLSIEQLLNVEVFTASKFTQKVNEAPSTVSIISAEDIRRYGYRTLADALKSLRGVYVAYDRNYSYLGTRGFGRPGDFNTRILLLIDGYRLNDNIFDQAPLGTDFPLDMALIERIEYVPGPGSAIYGANAFFGVINVITKQGKALGGTELSLDLASLGTTKARASLGRTLDNGSDLLLSVSGFDSKGKDRYFPEFDDPASNNGVAQNLDYDRYQQFFAKWIQGAVTLTASMDDRKKGIPTASYAQVFNDPRSHTVDQHTFLKLAYTDTLSPKLDIHGAVYYGETRYSGDFAEAQPTPTNKDGSTGKWWGAEARLLSTAWSGQKIVAGVEARQDIERSIFNYDTPPYVSNLDINPKKYVNAVYMQDEITLNEKFILNAGIRYDHDSESGNSTNPRLAMIYKVQPETILKLLHGSAFRAPNAYERYYNIGYILNPDLKSEKIKTTELAIEHQFRDNLRGTASLFNYKIDNLIEQTTLPSGDLSFQNSHMEAKGLELEGESIWAGNNRLKGSVSWQLATNSETGEWLDNSPRRMAKVNYTTPVFGDMARLGFEMQLVSPRLNTLGKQISGYGITNLTLGSKKLAHNLAISASIYDLFDRHHADPASDELHDILGRSLQSIRQDGRTYRLNMTYRF